MLRILILVYLSYFKNEINQDHLIKWTTNKKLTWIDFKGIPDTTTRLAAASQCYIELSTITSSDLKFVFEVKATFDTKKSWAWKEKTSGYLLMHEQKHFDLTELYARKLRRSLSVRTFTATQIFQLDSILGNVYLDSLNMISQIYDRETNHSLNAKM